MDRDLDASLQLAGFALAHAIWSVEDGETLCTLAFVENAGGRELFRYEAPSIPESVEMARSHLAAALARGSRAVLVFDGYARSADGTRRDALAAEILGPGASPIGHVLQPYRPPKRSRLPFGRRSSTFALLGEPFLTGELDDAEARRSIRTGFAAHDQGPRLLSTTVAD